MIVNPINSTPAAAPACARLFVGAALPVFCFTLFCAPPAMSADAAEKKEAAAVPLNDIDAMVAGLGHASFAIREKAMAGLWMRGKAALPALRLASAEADPEVSARAKELVLYITSGVLPDSPEEVKQLVIKFSRGTINNKLAILRKLVELGQWEQVLHLARSEENQANREKMAGVVQNAASAAARDAIVGGDMDLAGKILDLTGDDEQNMAMRAWFYVRRGQARQQLAKAAALPGKKGAVWRLSLHRANGDVKAAVNEAQKAGLPDLAAGLRVFDGNALPWLERSVSAGKVSPVLSMGYRIHKARLSGQNKTAGIIARELAGLPATADTATQAAVCLAANGYAKEAVGLMAGHDVATAFDYYDNIEDPRRCLELLGLGADAKPPYSAWVKKTTAKALEDEDDGAPVERLLMLASFLDRHGERQHCAAVMQPLMHELEKTGADAWFDMLKELRSYDLGWLAVDFAKARGNADGEMDLAIKKLWDNSNEAAEIWSAVKKRHPDAPDKALHEMALLAGVIADPKGETEKLHRALLAEIIGPDAKGDVPKQTRAEALFNFAFKRNNVLEASRMADLFAAKEKRWVRSKVFLDAALQRWAKVEPVYAAAAKENPGDYYNLMKWSIALRHLGRAKEAGELHDRALMLTMGDPDALAKIAAQLSGVGYDAEASAVWELSAVMAPAGSPSYDRAILYLSVYSDGLYEGKQWKKAAAISEVYTSILMRGRSGRDLRRVLRARFYADFYHAMHLLASGRRQPAIRKLDACRLLVPGDGSLADHFFPALREAGVGEHYERWFEDSYRRVDAACRLYPKSHNSHNTAAWLASRAVRRLDDALRHARAALEIRPLQGAYLDTMAEVWFARGDRAKAVEWSEKACAASIGNAQGFARDESQVLVNYSQLRKQLKRFKKAPLPQ